MEEMRRRDEITDFALMVDTLSEEERNLWDARRISDALVRETGLDRAIADGIDREVEQLLQVIDHPGEQGLSPHDGFAEEANHQVAVGVLRG
ncbi:MAG: hypothetical protein QXO86_06695 [Nitrososphaerota archaeon]